MREWIAASDHQTRIVEEDSSRREAGGRTVGKASHMAMRKQAYAGNAPYTARGDGKPGAKVWVVIKQLRNSTPDTAVSVAAYFREELARAHVAKLVADDNYMIGLKTFDVLDLPENES